MIDNEKMFEEVKEIILEGYPSNIRNSSIKKGRTPKVIKKVSIDECYSEYRKLKAIQEKDERFPSLLLAESLTISELDNLYQKTDYSFYDVYSFSKVNNLTKTAKRAEILEEILKAYKTNPIEYFINCLNSQIDHEIPFLEKVT